MQGMNKTNKGLTHSTFVQFLLISAYLFIFKYERQAHELAPSHNYSVADASERKFIDKVNSLTEFLIMVTLLFCQKKKYALEKNNIPAPLMVLQE